jgi:5-methylcytosine-specific restriction endonuclease McrA
MRYIKNSNSVDSNILVLNADYLPLNITTFKKAFKLVFKGKAEVVEDSDFYFNQTSKKPSVIRLIKYTYVKHRKIILSRENIIKRDGGKCGYCSSTNNLTMDHIKPKSKGGLNTWENF